MTFEPRDILALIDSPDRVGDQWRICRPYTRLRQTGVNARWAWGDDNQHLPTDLESTILVVRMLTGTDEQTIDRWIAERREKVRAIIYETDDAFYGPSVADHLEAADFMQGKTRDEILRDGEMSRYFASQCDGVIASSEPLAAMIRQDVDRPVIVVPNAIDVRWFRCQMAARAPWADHLTIGWCGGRRPEADLVPMAEAWGRIARRYPHVRFVVASPIIPDVIYREIEDECQVIRLPWVSWEDSPVLYQTDIGCCAVSDTPFSRAKTPIKAWEYAIGGAAVVATPTLYGDDVDGRLTGLLAETSDEWEAALVDLIESPRRRSLLHYGLLKRVERLHSLDGELYRWPDAYAVIVDEAAGVLA